MLLGHALMYGCLCVFRDAIVGSTRHSIQVVKLKRSLNTEKYFKQN